MKKWIIVSFAFLVAFVMPVSVSHALQPGCSQEFWEVQARQADAARVESKAYSMEIIKRPDPAPGLTCFDQMMGLTSKMGTIFSDKWAMLPTVPKSFIPMIPPPPRAYPIAMNKFLIQGLNSVISPVLTDYLGDFTGILSGVLGTTIGSSLSSLVSGPLNGVISGVIGYIAGAISSVLPLGAVLNVLNSAMTTLMSLIPATNCDKMAGLWDDKNITGGVQSIIGNGIEDGAPYFPLGDLLSGAPAGVGPELLKELAAPRNNTILTAAEADLVSGVLSTPGAMPSWQPTPVILPNTAITTIIGSM